MKVLFVLFVMSLSFWSDIVLDVPCEWSRAHGGDIDYPNVPRTSALEAIGFLRAGKGILIHAGGEDFKRRHIFGAVPMYYTEYENGKKDLPRLPHKGIWLLFYCY
jgi:hypothetical protein